jgi:hypothetical protein
MIEAQVNEENVGKFSLSRIILYLDGHIQELEKVLGKSRACLRLWRAFIAPLYNAKGYFAILFFLSSQLKSQTE